LIGIHQGQIRVIGPAKTRADAHRATDVRCRVYDARRIDSWRNRRRCSKDKGNDGEQNVALRNDSNHIFPRLNHILGRHTSSEQKQSDDETRKEQLEHLFFDALGNNRESALSKPQISVRKMNASTSRWFDMYSIFHLAKFRRMIRGMLTFVAEDLS
jgi:hypothetical protein